MDGRKEDEVSVSLVATEDEVVQTKRTIFEHIAGSPVKPK